MGIALMASSSCCFARWAWRSTRIAASSATVNSDNQTYIIHTYVLMVSSRSCLAVTFW